ncbi:MAG: phage tail protein [Saprospiraceae bacterium]|nr:phage tail protein [Saprospiraceae bacterium]
MDPFIAEIIMFAGNFAPRGWAFCEGQILSIASNTALFSLVGTTYGGDGRTTFALPDLRGRVAIHPGQGPGLSPYVLGQAAGTEQVTLYVNEIPAHAHTGTVRVGAEGKGSGASDVAAGSFLGNASADTIYRIVDGGNPANAVKGVQTDTTGGNQAHPNMQPYLCVNFIIALEGIFPPRS